VILVVEDEPALASVLCEYLEHSGLESHHIIDGNLVIDWVKQATPKLIILDLMLPNRDGLDIYRELRTFSDIPVVMATAKVEEIDRLVGLELGADDYITKPFHLAELNSRVNSLLRRRKFEGSNEIVYKEIEIDPVAKRAIVNEQTLDLTKKEYFLLLYFITNKDRVLTKEAIAEHLWGDNIDMVDNFDFIYTHMRNLRKKLKKSGANDYLQTIYGLGYKFGE